MQQIKSRPRLRTAEPVVAIYCGHTFRPNRAAWQLLGETPSYVTIYTDGDWFAIVPDNDPEEYKVSRPERDRFIQARAFGRALGLIDEHGVVTEPRTRYIPVRVEDGRLVGYLHDGWSRDER